MRQLPRFSSNELRVRSGLFLLLTLLATNLPAIADPTQTPPKSTTTMVRHQKKPSISSRNSGGTELNTKLDKAPEMPGITFPNAKFLYGFNTETKSGRNLGARFEVPDQSASVINYYKTSLKNTGWLVSEEGVKENQVVATNKQLKAAVTITTLGSSKPGCQVQFGYGVHN